MGDISETITQMRARHEQELNDLQTNCSHVTLSNWMPYQWAPGHTLGEVKVCATCGKIMQRSYDAITSTITTAGS